MNVSAIVSVPTDDLLSYELAKSKIFIRAFVAKKKW